MKALTWHGKNDIRCETVPDPKIQDGRDAIIKVTACAICGSDLHLFDGVMPSMEKGDVLGHETMGEVVEVGSENKKLKVGDRVVVPFTISCGECFFCKKGFFSGCERSNPKPQDGREALGPFAGRPVRLLAHAGRLCRRPGRISARTLRRCRPHQGAARPQRRAGPVPLRYLSRPASWPPISAT